MSKKKTEQTTLAPIDCKTFEDAMRLQRDNTDTTRYWLLLSMGGDNHVTICEQGRGDVAKQSIQIDKKDFDRFVRWYIRPQKTRRLKRVKPKRMTKKRWTQLMNEPDDEKARLSPDEVSAGWHWCWEYDGLLVGPDMPEWGKNKGRCICGFKPNELPK